MKKTIELPKIVSREEWLVARKALLAKERAGVGCRISTAKVTTGSATTIDTRHDGWA
jgi:predicted dithiol-disulfide oxidoreductase (DUF899 family)